MRTAGPKAHSTRACLLHVPYGAPTVPPPPLAAPGMGGPRLQEDRDPADTRGLGRGSLTILRLVGEPAVLGVLVDVVGVALGTLLGPEVLIGPRALLAVAYLVLELGPWTQAASIGWAAEGTEGPGDLAGRLGRARLPTWPPLAAQALRGTLVT